MRMTDAIKDKLIEMLEESLKLNDVGDKKWNRGYADALRWVLGLDEE